MNDHATCGEEVRGREGGWRGGRGWEDGGSRSHLVMAVGDWVMAVGDWVMAAGDWVEAVMVVGGGNLQK